MKIKGIILRYPPVFLAIVVLFAGICAFSFGATKDMLYVFVGVPIVILLIVLPLFMAYFNEKQVRDREPGARAAAKFVRARQVTAAMGGKAVILEGKIVKVGGIYMNRPVYVLQDASGQIVVKRFAMPQRLVGIGAVVEVLGYVYGRMTNRQSVYVNALSIRPIAKLRSDTEAEDGEGKPEEKIYIKHY
ncbi:MAG TPA: hypothetical protein O0X25_02535 [Methanocorpusculum sp.]|nr:hypothetical protein [Methanocorpusculum sp.]HJJ39994.1 hypothetical protein [Methanocorpusculum sp.]HJJ49477.1 hypothetical protein [Methanocorpusculum sp.]HJJ57029.1 hypothetical protein [Methanocorpusculum sp.]